MLKALLFASVLVAAIVNQASAEVLFRGNIVFTAVKNCTPDDAEVGRDFKSQFHPRVTGNDDFTALSLVYEYGALGHRIEAANFTDSYQAAASGGVGWGDGYTPKKRTSILISAQQPKTFSASTPSILLTGKLKNPWGDVGAEQCEVSFRGVYVQLVN